MMLSFGFEVSSEPYIECNHSIEDNEYFKMNSGRPSRHWVHVTTRTYKNETGELCREKDLDLIADCLFCEYDRMHISEECSSAHYQSCVQGRSFSEEISEFYDLHDGMHEFKWTFSETYWGETDAELTIF